MKWSFNNIDKSFWALFLILIVMAVIALFSASSTLVYSRGSVLGPIGSQMLFLLLGTFSGKGSEGLLHARV